MKLLKDISASLIEVLHHLPDEYYTLPISILDQQTIGQQVRHVIEHWQILSDCHGAAFINYGNRKRDKTIEQNKTIAIDLLLNLQQQINTEDTPVSIVSLDESASFTSSYQRELDNVTEHIIHHAAIIKMAILYIDKDLKIPAGFGYAPSTITYKKEQCAQ